MPNEEDKRQEINRFIPHGCKFSVGLSKEAAKNKFINTSKLPSAQDRERFRMLFPNLDINKQDMPTCASTQIEKNTMSLQIPSDFINELSKLILKESVPLRKAMLEIDSSMCFDMPFFICENYGFIPKVRFSSDKIIITIEKLSNNEVGRV